MRDENSSKWEVANVYNEKYHILKDRPLIDIQLEGNEPNDNAQNELILRN